jgi:hypothetical protein
VTGDTTYADPVKTELLNQITVAGTDWTNTSKWCTSEFSGNMFEDIPWIMRLLFAYDYLNAAGYTGFSAQNKIDINNWFHNAATYWAARTDRIVVNQRMSGARNNPPNYTCNGWACPDAAIGTTHWQGYTVNWFHEGWSNQMSTGAMLGMAVGILFNDSTLKRNAKLWVQEMLQFGTFADGSAVDQFRWKDAPNTANGVSSSWTHEAGQWCDAMATADVLSRIGDTSLYTYHAPSGQFGADSNNVSLLSIIQHYAGMLNGTVNQYGTNNRTINSTTRLSGINGAGSQTEDWCAMIPNIYYNDSGVHTAMTRGTTPSLSCGAFDCYGWPWGIYGDVPFMFGNLDSGQVNPYRLSGPTPTLTPTPTPTPGPISVDSTYPGYSTSVIDDRVINASGGNSSTWASGESSLDPHWIQINLPSAQSINSATIHWAFNNTQNKYMTSQQSRLPVLERHNMANCRNFYPSNRRTLFHHYLPNNHHQPSQVLPTNQPRQPRLPDRVLGH